MKPLEELTDQEIRIAIAKWDGWYRCDKTNPCNGWHNDSVGKHPNQYAKDPPDYLNDLNAVHEAEKKLDPWQWTGTNGYIDHLQTVTNSKALINAQHCIHATARQRCLALLKVIQP